MSFERACAVSELREGEATAVDIGGIGVAVVRDGEDLFAIENLCSHAAVELSEGDVSGCTIECWLHGSTFDLRTGKPTVPPATEPVATFPLEVRVDPDGPAVYVDTTTTLNGVPPQ